MKIFDLLCFSGDNEMAGLDYMLLTIVGISGVFGMMRQMALNMVTIVGWSLALVLAIRYFTEAASALKPLLDSGLDAESIGFVSVFLITLSFFILLGWYLDDRLAREGLTLTDRLFGLMTGLARGALAVVLAVGATLYFVVPTSKLAGFSMLLPQVFAGVEWLVAQLPKESELAAYLVTRRL